MQTTENFDIAIIGGGTAGMAAAIWAAIQGKRVVVWDAAGRDYDKPCGEGLMPAALRDLGRLGVTVPGHVIQGITYVLADGTQMKATLPSSGIGVRRRSLRRALWQRAEDLGVTIYHRPARDITVAKNGVTVEDVQASWLLVAEGIKSHSARKLGLVKPRSATARFGMRRHVSVKPWSDQVEVYWHEGCEAYVTPVAEDTVNIAFLSQDAATYDEMLGLFPDLKARLLGAENLDAAQGVGPLLHRTSRRRVGRVMLIGDAAGFVDAMTGEGNTLALGSGIAAVDAIIGGKPWIYEWRWWQVVWRYWLVTRIAVWLAVSSARRKWTLGLLRRSPRLLQFGLNFLVG